MEEAGIGSVFFIAMLWLASFIWNRDRSGSGQMFDEEEEGTDGF